MNAAAEDTTTTTDNTPQTLASDSSPVPSGDGFTPNGGGASHAAPPPPPKPRGREVHNPVRGAIVEVAAGMQVVAVFDFTNDAPNVGTFHLESDWMPPSAPDDDGDQTAASPSITLAPASGGSLRLVLAPPPQLALGDYDMTVRIVSTEGDANPSQWAFVLRVTAPSPAQIAAAAAMAPPPPAVPVAPPVLPPAPLPVAAAEPSPPASTPASSNNGVSGSENRAADTARPHPNVAAFDLPANLPASPPRPIAAPAPIPAPATPTPMPTAPPIRPTMPLPPQTQTQPAAAAMAAVPTLTDLTDARSSGGDTEWTTEPAETAGREKTGETVLQNPAEGTAFSVRPGESLLIRFEFVNEATATRTYVIDEDRSLPASWISLVQDQVNLSRNGSGHVSVRISPALDAEPGEYPFMVRVGPLGGVLVPRTLVLSVLPLPSVRLLAKETRLSIGPWGKVFDFPLTVERTGNCDTAFRVAVQAALDEDGSAPSTATATRATAAAAGSAQSGGTDGPQTEKRAGVRGGQNIAYETTTWRYLFDREIATLKSHSSHRLPPPEPVRLRLLRKGWWWLGFRETHQVDVEAVPVNDPANSQRGENVLRLTAVRWRLTPFPPIFLWGLLLLLLPIMGGKVNNFMASNAVTYSGSYYVLQENGKEDPSKPAAPMSAHLTWDAPWYSLLLLRASANNQTTSLRMQSGSSDAVSVEGYGFDRVYEIGPPISFASNSERIVTRFVPVRTDNKLQVTSDTGTRLESIAPSDIELGTDKKVIEKGGQDMTLFVSRSGKAARLLLKNTVDQAQGLNINVWLASAPPPDFSVVGLNPDTNETSNNQILPGATKPVQISLNKSAAAATAAGGSGSGTAAPNTPLPEMVLITTDKQHQVLHVHLKLVP